MLKTALLGYELEELAQDQSAWSQATFGSDGDRGPVGALKHLEKETREAVAAWQATEFDPRAVREELADCLLLLLDASRRAGLSPLSLVIAAKEKMVVNKSRTWPKTTGDVPSEHVR